MTDRHPLKDMPAWEATTLRQRLVNCLTQLAVDRMVTPAEAAAIRKRITAWLDKNTEESK